MSAPFLSLHNLAKSYREGAQQHCIFQQLNLELMQGEFVALLGRSGSGKSTLLNLISGIDLPDAGTIHLQTRNLTALSETERTMFRRQSIGFVYQFFNLIPTLTVLENVQLPLSLNGYPHAEQQRRSLELLAHLALTDCVQRYPEQLSGGEQQRVAIARALVHQPALLLADEPTGNLDAETGAVVLRLLLQLVRQQNCTVLMVTHSEDVAAQADRVLRLQQGRMADLTGSENLSGQAFCTAFNSVLS
jgi:putative ABC transport system ATP-binding protein